MSTPANRPLVRVHSECLTGDVFGSERCDCGPQLLEAVERIDEAGGFLLYLRQEGRGIGLYAKLDAYALQDTGLDTYQANVALGYPEDERDYTVAAQMLHALGIDRVSLLSNNPDKAGQLSRLGITVTRCLPTAVHLSPANARYLATKARRGSHTLDLRSNVVLSRRSGYPNCGTDGGGKTAYRPPARATRAPSGRETCTYKQVCHLRSWSRPRHARGTSLSSGCAESSIC